MALFGSYYLFRHERCVIDNQVTELIARRAEQIQILLVQAQARKSELVSNGRSVC